MMKYVLIIGDGMADNPVPALGNKTPLEYVKKDAIDALAKKGVLGSVVNCPKGLPAGSDTAILSIFGNDPWKCYTGRSPLEAAATGIKLNPGDVSYRCNMVALEDCDKPYEEKKILSHSGGSIDGAESIELVEYLFNHPTFKAAAEKCGMTVNPAPSFRHIAVQAQADIKGIKLIPPHDHLGEVIGPLLPSGCENAKALTQLMKLSNEILDQHPINQARRAAGKLPANGVWFWAEGTGVALDSFVNKYGHKGTVISAVPLCHGIARLGGLDVTLVEGATGELDTNYEGKVQAALGDLAAGYDFTAIHVEAPDECTHNGDTQGKLQAIEWLSSRVVAPLVEGMEKAGYDFRILILSDHKTLTSTRGHDGDPIPYLIYDSRVDTGAGLPYTEANGLKGPMLPAGTVLMHELFQLPY
jgi:2,3-bisphosphoglycerate-independent phosphoglycerate mutase